MAPHDSSSHSANNTKSRVRILGRFGRATPARVKRPNSKRVLKDLGRRVAELRHERGMTQAGLAERLDVTSRYVQSLEAGNENLTVISLVILAGELDAALTAFFEPPTSRADRRPGRPKAKPG